MDDLSRRDRVIIRACLALMAVVPAAALAACIICQALGHPLT